MKRSPIFILALLSLLVLMVGCGGSSEPVPEIQIDNWSEEIVAQNLGKKILLVFCSKSCGPCQQELPVIQQLADKKLADVMILAISNDSINDIKRMAVKYSFKFLADPSRKAISKYGVTGLPTNVFLDSNGEVNFKKVGFHNETVDDYIDLLDKIP